MVGFILSDSDRYSESRGQLETAKAETSPLFFVWVCLRVRRRFVTQRSGRSLEDALAFVFEFVGAPLGSLRTSRG